MTLRDTQAELRQISDQLHAARRRRDHNRRQADAAQTAIEQLGPIVRRLHRRQLHEQRTRHTTATTNLERANGHNDHLTARHKQLDAEHDRLTAQLKRPNSQHAPPVRTPGPASAARPSTSTHSSKPHSGPVTGRRTVLQTTNPTPPWISDSEPTTQGMLSQATHAGSGRCRSPCGESALARARLPMQRLGLTPTARREAVDIIL